LDAAQRWGREYWASTGSGDRTTLLDDIADRDFADLLTHGSLPQLVRSRHALDADSRISPEAVDRCCAPLVAASTADTPLFGEVESLRTHMRVFASTGVPILRTPDFTPSSRAGPPSRDYMAAPLAVDHKNLQAGLGILLPPRALPLLPPLNVINLGLAPKRGKPGGRLTINPSNNSAHSPPFLNSVDAADVARIRWGHILYPTIVDVIRSVLAAADRWGMPNVVLWKTDLKGAFSLLKFDPEDVHLMASFLASGHLYIGIRGNFGWSGMPFAFRLPSRLLELRLRHDLPGLYHVYCDDVIGADDRNRWRRSRDHAASVMRELFGPDAEEPDKRVSSDESPSRRVVVLGWEIDLELATVGISLRNLVWRGCGGRELRTQRGRRLPLSAPSHSGRSSRRSGRRCTPGRLLL